LTGSRYDADEIADPYSYRGSACLKNKLGLRDAEILQAFELEMSALRADEPLPAGRFGPTHYCRIHRHLFKTFIDGPADIEQLPPQREAICFAISNLNAIHPFREGNGRSQLAFLHLVAVWVLIWVHRVVALASDAAAAKPDS
jgi:cell filamentation protein